MTVITKAQQPLQVYFLKKKKSVSNILMSENIFFLKKKKKQVSRLLLYPNLLQLPNKYLNK